MSNNSETAMIKFFAVLTIIIIAIAGGISGYEKVKTNHFGLDRSTFSGEIDTTKIYEQGRHWIGFMHEFILFPATQQTIQFYTSEENAVTGRTQDGLWISLDVSFQYKLVKDAIVSLYQNFGETYNDVFWQFARDVIRDVASTYTAIEFFNNRTLVGSSMEDLMVSSFMLEYGINIPAYQLLQIDLPNTFEDALERAEVARQEIEIAKLQQEKALIEAETKILEAQAQYNVTLINAQAEADAFLTIIQAQAEAVNITLTAERDSYYGLAQALNMTTTELLTYMWIQALAEIGEMGNLIIIGENTPFINVSQPDNSTMLA